MALNFDFITDSDLRASLESDSRELDRCLASEAWKSVHVLSGSVVEAVLVDYFVGIGQENPDPLKMSFHELVIAAHDADVLSDKAADLCSVVKGYRNLIHPGRVLRLAESVDEDGARVAYALAAIVVKEVSAKQEQVYGLTADQLIAKYLADSGVSAISRHLLRDAKPQELQRLLVELLPERYVALGEEEDAFELDFSDAVRSLERLFRDAFEASPPEVKKRVVAEFARVVREEPGPLVQLYEDRFFQATDLEFATAKERNLVKDHLVSRLREGNASGPFLDSIRGLSKYLNQTELGLMVDSLARSLSYSTDEVTKKEARARLVEEFKLFVPTKLEARVLDRLRQWVTFHNEKDRPVVAESFAGLAAELELSSVDDDIPF